MLRDTLRAPHNESLSLFHGETAVCSKGSMKWGRCLYKWISDTEWRDIEFLNTAIPTAFFGFYFSACTMAAGHFCPCHLEKVGGTERP